MLKLSALFLLLSGVASLTYQVVWVRLLGLTMGSTSASISTVLAAFFMGLALGSYLAERITRNRINSLKVYIVLELIIGFTGLCLLPILLKLPSLLAYLPDTGNTLSSKFFITMILLALPTISMGATFPVMASILIRKRNEVGLRVSQLYSLNTAGAVLGAALAGFVFVPNWGLDGAVYIAFSINMLIVLLGLYINKRLILPPLDVPASTATVNAQHSAIMEDAPYRKRALTVLFATGLVAIATEVGWTKYLSIFTGTTIYGFAAILTVFLIGITTGSWAVKNYLQRLKRPEISMAIGLMVLGLTLLLTRSGLSMVPPIYEAINHLPASPPIKHGVKYMVVFLLIFPPTFLFGALFPLNLKLYCGNLQGVRARIGKAYAVNTVASIFGSLIAGFWLIPQYGTDVLLITMAIVILFLPVMFLTAINGTIPRLAMAISAFVLLLSSQLLPGISYKDLIASVQYKYDDQAIGAKKPKFLYIKEGKAGVISMVTYDGRHVKLQNNGLNESFIDLENEQNVLLVETLLGTVPYLMHDSPKSAFVVGFGGGITTKALTNTSLEKIKVVELEPAVVEAGRTIAGGEIVALTDPRVTLEFNDARNTLLLENVKYDIVVAQPSHPWLARASNVFTQEFFQLVKTRLSEGGIYGQWVNLFNMDATTLRSIFKAFYTVFPQGFTLANLTSGDFLLFGSTQEMIFDYSRIRERLQEPGIKSALSYHKIYNPQDLFWYFALSRQEALNAAAGMPANSDTNILSEVRLSALDGDPAGEENPYDFLKKHYHISVTPYIKNDVATKLYELADIFFNWDDSETTKHIVSQLKPLDEVRARGIEYEALWRSGDYKAATKLFERFDQWPDKTYYQHAIASLDLNNIDQAKVVARRIVNEDWRAGMAARILFKTEKWRHLSKVHTQSSEAQKWYLIGLSRINLKQAATKLYDLSHNTEMEIPQLNILVQYFSGIGDTKKLGEFTRQLVDKTTQRAERLVLIANQLLNQDQLSTAKLLLKQIDVYDPGTEGLVDLRNRINELSQAKIPPMQGQS